MTTMGTPHKKMSYDHFKLKQSGLRLANKRLQDALRYKGNKFTNTLRESYGVQRDKLANWRKEPDEYPRLNPGEHPMLTPWGPGHPNYKYNNMLSINGEKPQSFGPFNGYNWNTRFDDRYWLFNNDKLPYKYKHFHQDYDNQGFNFFQWSKKLKTMIRDARMGYVAPHLADQQYWTERREFMDHIAIVQTLDAEAGFRNRDKLRQSREDAEVALLDMTEAEYKAKTGRFNYRNPYLRQQAEIDLLNRTERDWNRSKRNRYRPVRPFIGPLKKNRMDIDFDSQRTEWVAGIPKHVHDEIMGIRPVTDRVSNELRAVKRMAKPIFRDRPSMRNAGVQSKLKFATDARKKLLYDKRFADKDESLLTKRQFNTLVHNGWTQREIDKYNGILHKKKLTSTIGLFDDDVSNYVSNNAKAANRLRRENTMQHYVKRMKLSHKRPREVIDLTGDDEQRNVRPRNELIDVEREVADYVVTPPDLGEAVADAVENIVQNTVV